MNENPSTSTVLATYLCGVGIFLVLAVIAVTSVAGAQAQVDILQEENDGLRLELVRAHAHADDRDDVQCIDIRGVLDGDEHERVRVIIGGVGAEAVLARCARPAAQ